MLSKERIEQLVAMASFDGDCECVNTRKAIELAVKESEAEAQARVAELSAAIRKHKKEIWDDFGINVGYDHDEALYEALASTDTTSIVQTETAFSHAYKTLQPEAKIISDVVARAAAKEKK